jgi:hypothetical protein
MFFSGGRRVGVAISTWAPLTLLVDYCRNFTDCKSCQKRTTGSGDATAIIARPGCAWADGFCMDVVLHIDGQFADFEQCGMSP